MEIITTHTNADFDALASMIAAKKLYPGAVLVFPGGQEKSIRDFLLKSALYVLDVEKASKVQPAAITRMILVDIRQASRIGKFSSLSRSSSCDVHIYDHHQQSTDDIRGSLEVIKPYGSTTTILCQMLQERNIDITPDEATVMMLGIYEDTGSLTFSSTTKEDYAAAAYLLSKGANLNIVADLVIKELTADQVAVLNELIENACVHTVHGVDVMVTKASSECYIGDFAVLVHKLKNMENVDVLFALANMDDRIYIVARSRIREVNAGDILTEFGGGGHSTAASATVHTMTIVQVEQKLLKVLHQKIRPVKIAKDFMSTPVKSIAVHESLEKASELLTRYNINVLPVIDDTGLVGIISRQIIEKAKHHGLKKTPVAEYMSTDCAVVHAATPLATIQHHIIVGNQRFLPVVEGKAIVGAITRTDLLRVLHVESDDGIGATLRQKTAKKTAMKTLLYERLPKPLLQLLKNIGKSAAALGYNAYAVGGFVRDIILRYENYDIDIVIEGDGIRFAKCFAAEYGGTLKAYRKFGTAVITVADGRKIDIASSRLEYYEKPAALPKVEWSSIKLDLYRRDFTMNTLAICLAPRFFGELIDFFGARRDIKEKTIRVLHNLSFVEDPSRIFRAIRFEQRFDFHISKLTSSLVQNAIKMDFLRSMSGKRIFSELVLLLGEERIPAIIKRLHELKLLQYIHASLQYDTALRNLLKNIGEVLSWFDLLYLDNAYEKWFVYLLGLFDRLRLDEIETVCQHFDIKKRYAGSLRTAKTTGNDILYWLARKKNPSPADIYRMLHPMPVEVSLFLMAKTNRQATKKAISLYFTQLHGLKIQVTGDDLIRLGIKPGHIYKKIFDAVLQQVLNGSISGKDAELKYIRQKYLRGAV